MAHRRNTLNVFSFLIKTRVEKLGKLIEKQQVEVDYREQKLIESRAKLIGLKAEHDDLFSAQNTVVAACSSTPLRDRATEVDDSIRYESYSVKPKWSDGVR